MHKQLPAIATVITYTKQDLRIEYHAISNIFSSLELYTIQN